MTSFVFWNVKELPRAEQAARLAGERLADVVILAESLVPDTDLIAALNRETGLFFCRPWSESSERIRIYTRYRETELVAVFDEPSGRLTIRRLLVGKRDVLLAAIHFHSKVRWSNEDQYEEIQNMARHIRRVEDDFGHRRTIVVGDLNMNPFERGVCSSHGLHGVMTRSTAAEMSRKVAGREYTYFYNPMWGFFGDRTPGPPGTHYYRDGTPLVYFWNIVDQLLIRPALLDLFDDEIAIVDCLAGEPLVDERGRPCLKRGSDHLPLHFKLRLES